MHDHKKWKKTKMMKIAVASENGMVTEHFGHCEGFMIFDTAVEIFNERNVEVTGFSTN